MKIETAVELIQKGIDKTPEKQVWIDLGAGTGTFTQALALLLPSKSKIYAIDKDSGALGRFKIEKDVEVVKSQMDFVKESLPLTDADGILMANSLHYVYDKISLIKRLKQSLKPSGRFIFLEYDMDTSNEWVPYPIRFSKLEELVRQAGFSNVNKLSAVPSIYHHTEIYSALVM